MTGIIKYKEEDFEAFVFFNAFESNKIKKKMRSWWITLTTASFVLSLAFYGYKDPYLAVVFFFCGWYYLVYYPYRQKKYYNNLLKEQAIEKFQYYLINDHYTDITEDYVYSKNNSSDGTTLNSEIKEIVDIKKYYFLKYKSGHFIILPKHSFELESLSTLLVFISEKYKIPVIQQLNWNKKKL